MEGTHALPKKTKKRFWIRRLSLRHGLQVGARRLVLAGFALEVAGLGALAGGRTVPVLSAAFAPPTPATLAILTAGGTVSLILLVRRTVVRAENDTLRSTTAVSFTRH